MAGHQLNPYFSQLSHDTVHWSWRRPTCPLEYKRHQWADIQAGKKRPYLFGGRQEPECTNCEVDALWSHFCQFKSHVRRESLHLAFLYLILHAVIDELMSTPVASDQRVHALLAICCLLPRHIPGVHGLPTVCGHQCDVTTCLRGQSVLSGSRRRSSSNWLTEPTRTRQAWRKCSLLPHAIYGHGCGDVLSGWLGTQ